MFVFETDVDLALHLTIRLCARDVYRVTHAQVNYHAIEINSE